MADARVGTTPYWFRFIDWPLRQGGTPKPAVIDTWLYVFQAHAKAARLQAEVFLQAAQVDEETGEKRPERYFPVDLKRHWGQDKRPRAEQGTDACWLDDSQVHVLDNVHYYVLCSPFQLAWSRIKDLAQAKDADRLGKLAREQRGLPMVLLDPGNTKPGPGSRLRIKAIRTPWGDGQALSMQFRQKLREWQARANTDERKQWRTLLAGIDMLSKGHRFKGLLDEDYLKNHVYATLLEDDRLFKEVEAAARKLIAHLRGPAMTAMEIDAKDSNDVDERGAFADIRLMLEARLDQVEAGREYRRAWYAEHEKLVLFDVVADVQKGVRKGAKAVWAWANSWAGVAAGYPAGHPRAGQVPGGLVGYARVQAKKFAGVHLLTDTGWCETVAEDRARRLLTDDEFAQWQRRRDVVSLVPDEKPPAWVAKLEGQEPIPTKFTKDSVQRLKAKVNENPRLTGLFALVDAVNVAFTLRALFDGNANERDRTKRIASATTGVCSFLSSALSFAKTQTLHLSHEEQIRLMIVRKTDMMADHVLSTYEAQGAIRRGVARASASRLLMGGLGAVGALGDVVAYSSEYDQARREARTGDSPDRIWILPGLGILGSCVSLFAYACLSATPPGAVLLVVGAALGATATISSIVAPARVSSDVEKWLMHSFVGKHRLSAIADDESFTQGKSLVDYHSNLPAQIAGLDDVLFGFSPTCEIYDYEGQPRLKIQVTFRQLKCRSRVRLKVFGYQAFQWRQVMHQDDWRPKGAPPQDDGTHLRKEGPAPFFDGLPAWGFDRMKIAIQIDVFGDGSYLYPKQPREVECKA